MADWFEQQGFVSREERREARADAYANTTPPVGNATPQPGMTAEEAYRIANDPNNARTSGAQGSGQAGGQEPFSEAAFRDLIQSYPPTNEGVRAAYAAAQARWGSQVPELLEHPTRLDKFRFADGRVIDFIGAAGGPNPSHVWNLEGPGHGGGGAPGAVGTLGGMTGIDPSYEWRFKEGQKALERSAAARGTLLTGGTLKALAAYGQGLASTEFGNIFDRNYKLAGLGLNAAQSAAQTSYGNQVGNNAANQAGTTVDLTTGAGNAQSAATATNAANTANTIGQVGAIVAPWLSTVGRGGGKLAGGRSDYLAGREGTV
jgi:hypothetical protein